MRKLYIFLACAILCACFLIHIKETLQRGDYSTIQNNSEESEGYDGARIRDSMEFEKTKDPALGYVPAGRLLNAIEYTENLKQRNRQNRIASLAWTERGPIYDSVGPSNGNIRGGSSFYTSGFMTAVLIDTLNDPSGNTVFVGGNTGGLWKCTNFLSSIPNWQPINDHYETLNIASICQDPSNPAVMYYSTGRGEIGSSQAEYGAGIWKSTDGGSNWTRLLSSSNFNRSFKIVCDAAGNVYEAERPAAVPIAQAFGLFRSKDHGATWTNITPANLTCDSSCTDIEISSTGRLHASFGFLGTKVNHWYTDDPANVTPTTLWNASTGIRTAGSPPVAHRLELACQGDILYGVTVNSNDNADSCYKSIDGGATWIKQNTSVYPTGVLNNQGWYDITLSINPTNSNEFIIGGLDAYKSTNSGLTANTRLSYWVTDSPYIHADHHFMQWWNLGAESRIVIGCDGGIFLSRDGAVTFENRNRNLAIKQFYSADIHPDAGSPYLLAGAQDNGTHQLKNPGLSYSTEVTGGDGCFVHINQRDPQIQFGSYVYNQYRRSTDGGQSWEHLNLSSSQGLFTNPYDYDDGQNIMYASNGSNAIRRWANANTASASSSEVLTVSQLSGSNTALKVSPYTMNRVFLGSNSGKLLRLDNANTVTNATIAANITNITGASFPAGNLNCINTGSSDQFLVAVFTNFGINNIWYSNNAGTSWSGIDGNLPDMPIRWAVFDPQHDDKMYIATATGVYHTDAVNGGSTVWSPENGVPTVRTDMLKIRLSDNTMVAGTYGRGLFTAVIPATPEVRFAAPFVTLTEETHDTIGCKYYKDYSINVAMVSAPTGDATVTYSVQGGNTATPGIDFDFTTNGDFNSPSTQHVFANGIAATKAITIRVYDDAEVEPTESFTLGFTISGTTDATAGSSQTLTVTIKDNDVLPSVIVSSTYTIGSASLILGNTTAAPVFDARVQSKRVQMLYKASELTAAGMSAGQINSVSFNLSKNSVRAFQNLQIRMGTTRLNYLVDGFYTVIGMNTVKTLSTYSTVNGWNLFTLDSPFTWDGISNVVVEVCYDNGTAATSDFADPIYAYSDPAAAQTQGNMYYQDGINCSGSFGTVTYYFFGRKPHMQFGLTNNGVIVASTLNASRTEYFDQNSDLYYYSSSGVLMVHIKNLAGFNYGCTQVTIDRAGTGASAFWNNTTANYLMNKTFHVVPATNNPSGQYEITLYFTKAEKEGWEAATGQTWNNIQLVKVDGQINQVTPANPSGAGNVVVVTPIRGTFGNDFTLMYTFGNGFSGFGAGIPGLSTPLPVTLLDFKGKLQGDNVLLNWSTTAEYNSKQFEIEKSYDGINFHNLSNVLAAGNSSTPKQYFYLDKEKASEINYYRLKMVDLDNRNKMSPVIVIRNPKVVQNVFVLNNPFTNYIDVRFAKMPRGKIKFVLTDLSGKTLAIAEYSQAAQPTMRFNPNGKSLSSGIYILQTVVDGQSYTGKVLKN